MPDSLNPSTLHWLGVRGLDAAGRVFFHDGQFFRAIRPEAAAFVRGLFEKNIPQQLAERGLLNGAEPCDLAVPGFDHVLRHPTLPWEIRAHEWPRTLLRDAARTWIELDLALIPHGLCLADAHGANFGQTANCRPLWLDFGSIIPLAKSNTAFAEFRRNFLHPLRLLYTRPGLGNVTRTMLRHGGISDAESAELLPRRVPNPARLISAVRRRLSGKKDAAALREYALREWRDELSGDLQAPGTYWQSYQSGKTLPPAYENLSTRQEVVLRILRDIRPRRVIDLAGNEGYFSFMAAREIGAEALGVDFDEGAADSLYRHARAFAQPLSINCAVANVMEPRNDRRRADLAFAFALTHHLTITQLFPWPAVAAALARNTTDALITEFMPNGLGMTKPKPVPSWYHLEGFLDALRAHFRRVEIVDYPPQSGASPRTMILCREKIAPVES